MDKKSLMLNIIKVIFLLWTILAISTREGWLYRICYILCILLLFVFIISSIVVYKKDFKKFIKDCCFYPRNILLELLVSITGLIISCFVKSIGLMIAWFLFLVRIPFLKKKSIDK